MRRCLVLLALLTAGATASQCTGSSVSLAEAECDAWVDFYDATGGRTTRKKCSSNRLDPCACSFLGGGVTCSISHITAM